LFKYLRCSVTINQTEYFVHAIFFRVSSENNTAIFDRVINQTLLEHGGPERCPWTRAIIEGTLFFIKAIYSNVFMHFK